MSSRSKLAHSSSSGSESEINLYFNTKFKITAEVNASLKNTLRKRKFVYVLLPFLFTLHQIADDLLDNKQFDRLKVDYSDERVKSWELKAKFYFGIALGTTNISLLV